MFILKSITAKMLIIFAATVTGVVDGDTVDVLTNGAKVRVRLYGIDAPEKKQKYGLESTACATAYLKGQRVTLKTYGHDLYGRVLAEVFVNGFNQNINLVLMGCAWATPQYLPIKDLKPYVNAQIQAMQANVGLWNSVNGEPVEPWIWRKQHKP